MPRKRSTSSLEEMCWKTAFLNLKTLKQKAKSLSIPFINEFYRRSCIYLKEEERKSRHNRHLLPSELFLTRNTRELLNLKFDLINEKMLANCENLKRIALPLFHSDSTPKVSVLSIIINNPLLVHLDLRSDHTNNFNHGINDRHLLTISTFCPKLKYLNIEGMKNVTDLSMKSLPVNLSFLNIYYTNITPNGCLTALNRLKSLKVLKHYKWLEILDLLRLQPGEASTYPLERLEITDGHLVSFELFKYNFLDMFPNLRDIQLFGLGSARVISSLMKNKENLITYVDVCLDLANAILIGQLCPMLKEFVVRTRRPSTQLEMPAIEQVVFKNLRKLTLTCTRQGNYQLNEFEALLEKVRCLKSLEIESWEQLNDGIVDIIGANVRESLENIKFADCCSLTVDMLIKLMNSLEYLRVIEINYCPKISYVENEILKNLIEEMNWDVNLFVRREIFPRQY